MALINTADKIYLGATPVDRVYFGATKVWEPEATEAWGPEEVVYGAGSPSPSAPGDGNSFTVGSRMTVLANGRITGLRHYTNSGQRTSRYVGLWSDTGVLLASGTTSGDTAGWNVHPITPINVTAGQILRSAHGYYGSGTDGGFPFSMTTAPLGSTNLRWEGGVYSDAVTTGGEDDYPANAIAPNHYYGDVVFQQSLAPWGPNEGVYAAGATPAAAGSDTVTFSVGNQIQILTAGRITGIRHWRDATSSLTSHSVDLWTDAGVLLAHGVTTGDVVGWNTFAITPVSVSAGDIVRVTHGQYGSAAGDSWPYNASAHTSVSPNLQWLLGVYAVGPVDGFPSSTTGGYNYFVDIVYQEAL